MSFNNLSYDHCTYSRRLTENVSILDYVLSPFRFEHAKKCRHNLGLVGGSAVSHVTGNLVDLESDIRGQTRYLTKCIDHQHKPLKPGQSIVNDKTAPISTNMVHLPACQMISYKAVPFPMAKGYDACSYQEKLRRTVGPGMYMLGTPNNDVQSCGKDIPADPYMRFQHFGPGTCVPGSAVDDGSELLGLHYKTTTSKCSSDSYVPGKYASKGICNVPGKANPRACMAPTENTRLSNPPCTLHSTGWNRWEWLCYDPQEKAIIPFEWNTSYRIVAKDNHVPCIEQPMDQEAVMPPRSAKKQHVDWTKTVPQGCGAAAPGNSFNAGFTSCTSVANQ